MLENEGFVPALQTIPATSLPSSSTKGAENTGPVDHWTSILVGPIVSTLFNKCVYCNFFANYVWSEVARSTQLAKAHVHSILIDTLWFA